MRFLCIGANHKTAPVEVRERLSFSEPAAAAALRDLRAAWPAAEAVIVSTCNRSEIHLARPVHQRPREADLRAFLGRFHGLRPDEYDWALYVYEDAEAVRHLFTVAAGLDSLVPGEVQIAAQLKAAYAAAREAGATEAALNDLFQMAFNVAKHARAETAIAAGKVSVASVTVDLAAETLGDLSGRCVLAVGAGKMIGLMVDALARAGAGPLLLANRSPERAERLAERAGGRAVAWDRLAESAARADLIVCSTASPTPVLTAADLAGATAARPDRPLLILDVAVPRDVQPAAADLPGVTLRNIDDLSAVVQANLAQRTAEIDACRRIIDEHVAEYFRGLHARYVAPTVEALYRRMRAAADEELAAAGGRLTGSPEADRAVIRRAVHRALRRVLHTPIARLRDGVGTETARQHAAALRKLFDLDNAPPGRHGPPDEPPEGE
jgi:glutamyl-tRNA reductase